MLVVRDLGASLRCYRDGLGLSLRQDRQAEGDWPDLFDPPSRRVRAVFPGDAPALGDHGAFLKLNASAGDLPAGREPAPRGLFVPKPSSQVVVLADTVPDLLANARQTSTDIRGRACRLSFG